MLTVVLGTRPEIIKCAPVIFEAKRRGIDCRIIHTGQHYSPEMDRSFFKELNLPDPAVDLHIGSLPAAEQIGTMIVEISKNLNPENDSIVLVQGDTNTVLAGAIASKKTGIPVAHLEAGLRSDDLRMPEEINRILTDHISDILFCPTETQKQRLTQEGIVKGVEIVGNTIVDSVLFARSLALSKNLNKPPYILLTLHRPSNVDEPERLKALLDAVTKTSEKLNLAIQFPVHPRTENNLKKSGLWDRLNSNGRFNLSPPIGYIQMVGLESEAAIIMTDSGGIQEEANILKTPCITLRENTERPETIEAGGNFLFPGVNPKELTTLALKLASTPRDWPCPFGNGHTAEQVLNFITNFVR